MNIDFPPIYLLPTNLQSHELHSLEERIPSLTWDVYEAEVIAGKITRRERALFELRRLKLSTEELPSSSQHENYARPSKRRKVSNSEEAHEEEESEPVHSVKVVRLSWLTDSLEKGSVLPTQDYLLYEGRKVTASGGEDGGTAEDGNRRTVSTSGGGSSEQPTTMPQTPPHSLGPRHSRRAMSPRQPPLLHETTSEHSASLPPVPDYLRTKYSCQRPTPVDTPNAAFIEQMKAVRTVRLLEGDEVGVRAYSTSIASIAAYPHPLRSSSDVSRLPGCGAKIAELFQQWKDTGGIREATVAEADARMSTLKLFYGIWGVGAATARDFYNKGWRDLDDVVEHGWDSLSRVQQIGIKYYDDFERKIPRREVEEIGRIVLSEARKLDAGYHMVIVGGYRRGKAQCGDVDVVLSHQDEARTLRLVDKMVTGLERSGHIKHMLILGTRNSERGQVTLPWRGVDAPRGGGFDTLDKAMVVWQEPGREDAPHRRVDIIVSPWRTVGCAVLGWTGATTFERDLRRYCKEEKGLKFDSSGVRGRADGSWVDLESSGDDVAPDMETAERRVFAGLGLAWRSPDERCTG